jgi:hypothetical protein
MLFAVKQRFDSLVSYRSFYDYEKSWRERRCDVKYRRTDANSEVEFPLLGYLIALMTMPRLFAPYLLSLM